MLRALGAGLFVFGGLLAFVVLLGSANVFAVAPLWLVSLALVTLLLNLLALAWWLFNPRGTDLIGGSGR